MKINFTDYNMSEFILKQDEFNGIPAVLVTPSILGVNWTKDNLFFRSSIWDMGGNLISASFPKFFNYTEKEEITGKITSLKNASIIDKIDGSTAIFDFYNNKINARTRGTFNYQTLDNAADFEFVLQKYTQIEQYLKSNPQYSLLCEITTPNNKIVLDYGNEVKLHLIGLIDKNTYQLASQNTLDKLGETLNIDRPKRYYFSNVTELYDTIQNLKGIEGVVVYTKSDQLLTKFKSIEYLTKHAFKEHASLESVIDLFIEYNQPNYTDFCTKITQNFDFECLQMVQGFISQVCDAFKQVTLIESHMKSFVDQLTGLSRKEQAEKIISAYGNTNRSGYVFMKLDNKQFTSKEYKKLLWQILKM